MKVFAEKCTLVRIQSSAPYVPVAQMEEHVTSWISIMYYTIMEMQVQILYS